MRELRQSVDNGTPLIAQLEEEDPALFAQFIQTRRRHSAVARFISESKRYELTAKGRINYYPIFTELMRTCLRARGRFGIIVPSGIATDDSTKFFFQDLVETRSLMKRPWDSLQIRFVCRFGSCRFLVLMFECETLLATFGRFPVRGHTRAMLDSD